MTDFEKKEKLKDSAYASVITGLTWYFITQNEQIGLIGGIAGGITTYKNHDDLDPFISRVKKNIYGDDWWMYEGGWDGTRLVNNKGEVPPVETTVIDKEITAGDVMRYALAPFTLGFSLRF